MKWAERVLEAYDSLIGKTAVIQGRVLEDPDIDKKVVSAMLIKNPETDILTITENLKTKYGRLTNFCIAASMVCGVWRRWNTNFAKTG